MGPRQYPVTARVGMRHGLTSCSAGREDADVRMLGRGRPFVLEIINARNAMPPQSYFDDAQRRLNEVCRACRCRLEQDSRCTVKPV